MQIRITKKFYRSISILLWFIGISLLTISGMYNVHLVKQETESRLISESSRISSQLAALLTLPTWELDELSARTIVMAAMDDDNIYAIKVMSSKGMLEGQRRNHQWEPIPWDDEIIVKTVQGINPLKMEGRTIGVVEVYLASRMQEEEVSIAINREIYRFIFGFVFLTSIFVFVLWTLGDLHLLVNYFFKKQNVESGDNFQDICDFKQGFNYQIANAQSWFILVGFFKHTFANTPSYLMRIYKENNYDEIKRIGKLLQQVAPCLGAFKLEKSARNLQNISADSDDSSYAIIVEECIRDLEGVLRFLNKNED